MSWDHAYGALLGVLCGDAAGAPLEFARSKITERDVDKAVQMPGGGIFKVGPGQITDDSELALALARGLVGQAPTDGFPLESVASQYHQWFESDPYDIGNTCSTAFNVSSVDGSYARAMINAAAKFNTQSEANGSLMRVLPLAIWAFTQPDSTLVALAREEARLSHPSVVCQDSNAVYCLLVAHLIRHPGDAVGAVARAERFVLDHVNSSVRDWFLTESLDVAGIDCTRSIGHVRWAFVLAIHHLRNRTPYEEGIRRTLLLGGDTDTNAAIVGGVLGALHGQAAIPEFMKRPVLTFDCVRATSGRRRPHTCLAAQAEGLVRELLRSPDRAGS
ncbi:hypothetical protein P43SY_010614 [Pythium insidiosum]|uniref:ADP-ribosylglycohydrolase n=1 Tax=Pythium insidiosum TaxID=114742 RepID=A0AAD5L7K1_PYTIN|nr:hypothetical protein P43SY_010614 [Pythium insidiosum]